MEEVKGVCTPILKRIGKCPSLQSLGRHVDLDLQENQVLTMLRTVTTQVVTVERFQPKKYLGLALDYVAATNVIREKFLKLDKEKQEKTLFLINDMIESGSFPVDIAELTQWLYGYSFVP